MEGIEGLLEAARQMGIGGAVVFAILWWFERSDRKALQLQIKTQDDAEKKYREDMLRETIGAINNAGGGFKEVAVGGQQVQASLGVIAEIVKNIAARLNK
jgi:hypothetical protein